MTDEAPAADFVWTDYFEFARELANLGGEAAYRSVVSRSYYAVFNTARQVLMLHDPEYAAMRSHDSHKQVWDRLSALERRQAKTAVRCGRSLLRERKAADYQQSARDWPRRAQQALMEAERALRALQSLVLDPPAQPLSGSVYIETPRMSSRI